MGLLSKGTPLSWDEAKKYADHIRKHGIIQFLNIYSKVKNRTRDRLLWGDEIEYMLVNFDDTNKTAKLELRAVDVLEKLQKDEEESLKRGEKIETSWKPEYAGYMLEATPGYPYGSTTKDLLFVEENMALRRQVASKYLKQNEALLSITVFPLLGYGDNFLSPKTYARDGKASHSIFVPDQVITPHARFPTLTANIRERRGKKVAINVPIFHDKNTPKPFIEKFPEAFYPQDGAQDAIPDHIYLDCMCFGMGMSCLQVTFQACNITEARYLYDQLAVLSPIFLALTANAPILRGYLADTDCRWDIISKSVDDRTSEEKGLENSKRVIKKSRYDSIDCFISNSSNFHSKYNDIDFAYDEDIYEQLLEGNVDELLAKHFSHLFIRDPLVVYKELLNQDDSISSDHFENIQSTNWNSVRFKPPPPNSNIGWRVEFRSMEIQFTDFENAAFCIFLVLLSRAILSFGLNFYIPMSKVDENMKSSQKRDAINLQKFHFRKYVFDERNPCDDCSPPIRKASSSSSVTRYGSPYDKRILQETELLGDVDEYCLMSIDEIVNGRKTSGETLMPGLMDIVDAYLNSMNIDIETRMRLNTYLQLIRGRANGTLMTGATWIRKFVQNHPEYKFDSVVSESINYDLLNEIRKISEKDLVPVELFGQ